MPKNQKARQVAVAEYADTHYDRISLRVSKGRKDVLHVHAFGRGESLNAFINRAIDNQLLRDNSAGGGNGGSCKKKSGNFNNEELALLDFLEI